MMGSEKEEGVEADPLSSRQGMESLLLDEQLNTKSYASYQSAMSSLPDTHHPLSPSPMLAAPADSDPLLSLPKPISSFEGHTNNGISIEGPKQKLDNSIILSPTSSEYMNISVTSPQKEQETSNSIVPGSNTHVTYLIKTRTNVPEFGRAEFSVRRRFKEVVALSERLSESYRGYFIPLRPDKNVMEGQVMHKQEFVEQRRLALEKYLRKLASHPVIRKSNELKAFLQVPGKLPLPTTNVATRILDGAVKLPKQLHEVVQPARGGRDLLRMFKELKQSVSNDWKGLNPLVVEEDKEFLEKKEKLHDLEQQLSNATQRAESFVKAQQDFGETMGELGLAFIKLTKFENEVAMLDSQRIRAVRMKGVATAAVKASRICRGLNTQTVEHLDTLHEYLGLMLAVHNAFSDRSSALLTLQTLTSELSSLHTRREKLEASSSKIYGGDKARTPKIEELEETIRVTEDAKQCAVKEYEQIKENNRSELERFDRERWADFLKLLRGFTNSQVEYAESMANIWGQIAEETSGYEKEST